MVMVTPELAEPVAKDICERWDCGRAGALRAEDVERGYIDVTDRRNQVHRFPDHDRVSGDLDECTPTDRLSHQQAAEVATRDGRSSPSRTADPHSPWTAAATRRT